MLEVTLNTLVYSSDTVMQFYSPLRYHLENVSACLALGDAFPHTMEQRGHTPTQYNSTVIRFCR